MKLLSGYPPISNPEFQIFRKNILHFMKQANKWFYTPPHPAITTSGLGLSLLAIILYICIYIYIYILVYLTA